MTRSSRLAARVLVLLTCLLLVAGVAFGQQPPQPQPMPPGHPPMPPMPGQAQPGRPMLPPQPGMPQPGMPGRPRPMPGQFPPGHPSMPGGPGGRPLPGRPMPRPVHQEEEHAAKHVEHCPGHGPTDPPPPINFGHGLLGVDNDKAPPAGSSPWVPSLYRYENKDDACDPRNEPPPFLASLINFGGLVFLLYRFGKKPIGEALAKRKESIMQEIDTAARLKDDARKRLKEYKKRFTRIEDTLAEITAEYAAQAEAEKTRILAEAEERRARMRRDAEFRIGQELKAARAELLAEAVEGAVAAAEQMLKTKVSPADLDRMNDGYLTSLAQAVKADGARTAGGRA